MQWAGLRCRVQRTVEMLRVESLEAEVMNAVSLARRTRLQKTTKFLSLTTPWYSQ